MESDLSAKFQETSSLLSEVDRLRQQLQREQSETGASLQQYTERIEALQKDNTKLQMKLMKEQLQESVKDSESVMVKKEVLEKTMAIEKIMAEFQQQQLDTLAKVKNLAKGMLSVCSQPSSTLSNRGLTADVSPPSPVAAPSFQMLGSLGDGPHVSGESKGSVVGSALDFKVNAAPGPASQNLREISGAKSAPSNTNGKAKPLADEDMNRWFHSMKANLEHFGDVEVFIDDTPRECACCLEHMATAFRIRPRKCGHVFHIECMLQWWTEGTCPVCRTSFAPEPAAVQDSKEQQNGNVTDRFSTVSSAVGGRGRRRSPSPPSRMGAAPGGVSSVVSAESRRAPRSDVSAL